ncbi:nucleolar protein 4 [Elysia marginata]|uniref:Nucleolar protein 4 n=1 Tax=Elysia marginata TaxID=1093978 RepID=A0AAV4H962_9GAST|nr:nucleolar protein 4 [Elysia marginata]
MLNESKNNCTTFIIYLNYVSFTATEDLPLSIKTETDTVKSPAPTKEHMIDADCVEVTEKAIDARTASVGVPLEIFPYRFPESEAKRDQTSPRSVGIPQVVSPRLSDAHLAYLLKLPHSSSAVTPNPLSTSPAAFSTVLSPHLNSPFQPFDKRLSRSLTTAATATQGSFFDHRVDGESSLNYLSPNTPPRMIEPLRAQHQQDFSSNLEAYVLSRLSTATNRPPHSIDVALSVDTKRFLPPLQINQDFTMDSPFMISNSHRLAAEKVHQQAADSQPSPIRSNRNKERQKMRMANDLNTHGGAVSGSVDLTKDREVSVTQVKRRRPISYGHSDSVETAKRRGKLAPVYGPSKESSSVPAHIKDSEMYRIYNSWALKNYGDAGKTKTVTRNKYERIVRILIGDESSASDNAKFKFWVKAKGFCLSPMKSSSGERILLVPSKHEVRYLM